MNTTPSNPRQRNNSSMLLGVIAVIATFAMTWFAGYLVFAWYSILLALALFVLVSGHAITGRWTGALIDGRNVMSLSRFQIILWTLLLLSAFLVAAVHNIFLAHNLLASSLQSGPLNISIQPELWALMGISTASLVGSPLILSDKMTKTPNSSEVSSTFESLKQQGDEDSTLGTKGHIVVNTDISKARWSDMITGEEVGNASHLDVARLQMLFFTLITVLAYAVELGSKFSGDVSHGITDLPALDKSMIALIGISHTGYLTAKAVPHSQSGSQQPAPTPMVLDATDEHPAVG